MAAGVTPINPGRFYGGERNELRYRIRINTCFATQRDAFCMFDQLGSDSHRCKVFSFESPSSGKRQFLVADLETFYKESYCVNDEHRHLYEIVRDTFPCRLYFDIEFNIPANPGTDGDVLVLKFIHLVLWKLYQAYGLAVGTDRVLVLDSTTPDKFSKHVIVILLDDAASSSDEPKEFLFVNNLEAGVFVQSVVRAAVQPSRAEAEDEGPRQAVREYEWLWVNSSDGRRVLAVDIGVYTRNRAFRLFNSRKHGKTARLAIVRSDRDRYPMLKELTQGMVGRPVDQAFRTVLEWTFVVPADVLGLAPPAAKRLRSCDATSRGHDEPWTFESFAEHFNKDRYELLAPSTAPRAAVAFVALAPRAPTDGALTAGGGAGARKEREVARSRYPRQVSAFPSLDQFVGEQLASRGGVAGYVQSWLLLHRPNGELPFYAMRYQLGGNRFCECVQRMHKSNGIFFEVNLMAREVRQGCWDLDCRGFPFAVWPLPEAALPLDLEGIVRVVREAHGHELAPRPVSEDECEPRFPHGAP